MGSNLIFRLKPVEHDLPNELKSILRENFTLPRTFTIDDVKFLAGLVAAGVKPAQKLIDAIAHYEEIEVLEIF